MKTALRISIGLNLGLLAGLVFILLGWRRHEAAAPVPSETGSQAQVVSTSVTRPSSGAEAESFRWSQLASARDYRAYIANLRAIGCPEPTIEDIVRGDAARAFSWERHELGLDGSGAGPWSRSREMQLVAGLLGAYPPDGTATVAQSAGNETEGNGGGYEVAGSTASGQIAANRRRGGGIGKVTEISMLSPAAGMESPSYPLFLQNPDWGALGFTAEQQATIAQVRQQFQNEISSLSQNADASGQNGSVTGTGDSRSAPDPNDPSALTQWQKALQNANQQLSGMLGAQAYMAYEQQQYYAWYQPQVAAAAASGDQLTINPAAFH
jgi:hypothetical protein